MKLSIIFLVTIFLNLFLPSKILSEENFKNQKDYDFQGEIQRNVLENYLDKSITMAELCNGQQFLIDGAYENKEDDFRMLRNIGAKFIGRSMYFWGHENHSGKNGYWDYGREMIEKMHEFDSKIIFQAAIFEIVTQLVEEVSIPYWVFEEFELSPIKRNFCYDSMVNKKNILVNHWGKDASVPDINRLETQLWFFFLAKEYIDIGIEAIHFGQMELMSIENKDESIKNWSKLLDKIRNYAKNHARRNLVLIDGHIPSGGLKLNNNLLLDFHSFPLRPKSIKGKPQKAVLELNYLDSFYGRSFGGVSPSGWFCEHLPYLIEFDNFGISLSPGKFKENDYYVWGFDEISWFSLLSKSQRNKWIKYAWKWVRKNDKNGHLEMPGSRVITINKKNRNRYRANEPSIQCKDCYGQEGTIKKIWKKI